MGIDNEKSIEESLSNTLGPVKESLEELIISIIEPNLII